MIRLIVRTAIALVGNAVGLLVAAIVLSKMHVNVTSFLVAVLIFTIVLALIQPFIAVQLRRRSSSALGGVALLATLVALLITDLISSGFSISGVLTWVEAAVIVWGVSLLAVFILPYLGLKKYLQEKNA